MRASRAVPHDEREARQTAGSRAAGKKRLTAPQRRALEQCAAMRPVDGNREGWLALAGSGIMRPVVRALQKAGVIEGKYETYPGKLIGQYYRVTPAGHEALAAHEDGGR